jgi:alpha-ketoglutarate-dependent 2,4-dichlorophenoxyacetate dioxygenase
VGKHKMVQLHEPSNRPNLYVGNHIYTIEGMSHAESQAELEPLLAHLSQDKYVASVGYENEGDLVIWDNTCVV